MTASEDDAFTYVDVGATLGELLPDGYHHVRRSALLGHGNDCFNASVEALMTWQVQRRSGMAVRGSTRVAMDEVVWLGPAAGPLQVGFRCKVVAVVDEPNRKGFAYGTLPGHPEAGEELFVIERSDDGPNPIVAMQIVAFSRPAQWWSRMVGPAGRAGQRLVTSRYLKVLAGT